MVKRFCNVCQKELTEKTYKHVKYRIYDINENDEIEHETRNYYLDICNECFEKHKPSDFQKE